MKSTLVNMVAVLFTITLVASAGVGYVNMITVGPIAEAKAAATQSALRAVLLFPVFMASWLPLNLVSLLFRTRVWKEIEHGSSGENVKTLFQKNSQPVFRLAG